VQLDNGAIKLEIREVKRRWVIDAASDLFYRKGYQLTTVSDIADRLQVSKPTIYAYFAGKTEILHAICEIGITNALQLLDELPDRDDPAVVIRMMAKKLARLIMHDQMYIVVYAREQKNLKPEHAEHLMGLRREFSRRLADFLERGRRLGKFEVQDPMMMSLAIGGLITWISSWYRPGGRWTAEEVESHIASMVDRLLGLRAARRVRTKDEGSARAASMLESRPRNN
jgi:AcrR family transcriptional regulator